MSIRKTIASHFEEVNQYVPTYSAESLTDDTIALNRFAREASISMEQASDLSNAAVDMISVGEDMVQHVGLESVFVDHAFDAYGLGALRPSMEAEDGKGVVEFVKRIFKAIYDAIVKAFRAIAGFVDHLFGGMKKMESKIDGLIKLFKDSKVDAVGETFTPRGGAGLVRYGMKSIEVGELEGLFFDLSAVNRYFHALFPERVNAIFKAFVNAQSKRNSNAPDIARKTEEAFAEEMEAVARKHLAEAKVFEKMDLPGAWRWKHEELHFAKTMPVDEVKIADIGVPNRVGMLKVLESAKKVVVDAVKKADTAKKVQEALVKSADDIKRALDKDPGGQFLVSTLRWALNKGFARQITILDKLTYSACRSLIMYTEDTAKFYVEKVSDVAAATGGQKLEALPAPTAT